MLLKLCLSLVLSDLTLAAEIFPNLSSRKKGATAISGHEYFDADESFVVDIFVKSAHWFCAFIPKAAYLEYFLPLLGHFVSHSSGQQHCPIWCSSFSQTWRLEGLYQYWDLLILCSNPLFWCVIVTSQEIYLFFQWSSFLNLSCKSEISRNPCMGKLHQPGPARTLQGLCFGLGTAVGEVLQQLILLS